MENSNKHYKKALKYYYDGKIHNAMTCCSKCLSINPKDSKALSLKGMLLYFQGNLKEARKLWERNYKINGDEVAKKYLVDSREDFEKMDIYDEAVIKIREMNIDLAIKLLLHCKKSDFNRLNVDMRLIECYMKKAEYEKLIEIIADYKIVDKHNRSIKEIEKELIKIGVKEKESKKELMIKCGIAAGLFVVIFGLGRYTLKIMTNDEIKGSKNVAAKNDDGKKNTDSSSESKNNEDKTVEVVVPVEPFDREKVNEMMENKEIEALKGIIAEHQGDKLDMNDSVVMNKAVDFIKENAVEYYISKGKEFYDAGDYENALKEYTKGIEHIEYERENDQMLIIKLILMNIEVDRVDEVLKYADMLYKNYKDGAYTPDTIYQTACYLDKKSDTRAKSYAQIIENDFSDTIYNNEVIEGILY